MNTVAQTVQIYEPTNWKVGRSISDRSYARTVRFTVHTESTLDRAEWQTSVGPHCLCSITMWWWVWSSMWSCAWAVGWKQLMPRKWLGRLVSVLEEELVEMSKRRSLKILSIVDDPGRARLTDWSPQQWKAQCCTTEHGRRSFPAVAVRLYDSSLFNHLKHFKNLHMHISTLTSYSIHLFFTRWED